MTLEPKFVATLIFLIFSVQSSAQTLFPTPTPTPNPYGEEKKPEKSSFFEDQRSSNAPTPSTYFDADEYSMKDGQASLNHNVIVTRGTQKLTCDKALVNTKNGEILAEGNVTLISGLEYIKAEKLFYNLNKQTGIIYRGFIQRGKETIEGEEIYKIGPNEYTAKKANYTTCVSCPAGWKVSGSNIVATPGDYAYITNSVVKIYSVPVFWLPYLAIPIKKERQTGLLQPNFSVSGGDDGFVFSESFFWNISKNKDLTLTSTYSDYRGTKGSLEYRFASDKMSWGGLNFHYISDRKYGQEPKYTRPDDSVKLPPDRNPRYDSWVPRTAVTYQHYFLLPQNYYHNVDLTFTRDRDYISDFPKDTKYLFHSELTNRINVAKNTENAHASVDLGYYQNLLVPDPIGENDALHRAPEFRYTLLSQKLPKTNLLAKIDFNYLNLVRADKAYLLPNGFTEDDIAAGKIPSGYYRTGQRVILRPELSYPFHILGFLDLLPSISYDEAFYQFGYSSKPTTSRRYVRNTIKARTTFSQIFGGTDHPLSRKFKHQIEPELTFTSVPYFYNEEHPFFGKNLFSPRVTQKQQITENDSLQFDYKDRLYDRNILTYSVTQKLIQRRFSKGKPGYGEIIRHKLSQSYDLVTATEKPSPDDPGIVRQPWSEINSELSVKLDWFDYNNSLLYFPYQNAATHSSTVGVGTPYGSKITLSYNYNFFVKVDPKYGVPIQRIDFDGHSQTSVIAFYLSSKYIDAVARLDYNISTSRFTSESIQGLFKPPGGCWGIQFELSKSLGKEGYTYSFNIPVYYGEGAALSLARPEYL